MARHWQQISPEDAQQHPLYGIKNWLAVFGFGVLLIPLRAFGELNGVMHDAGLSLAQLWATDVPVGRFFKMVLGLDALLAALILWLLWTKDRSFRVTTIWLLLAYWPMVFFVAFITKAVDVPNLVASFTLQVLASSVVIGAWVAYLHRSRRVRVTFENCVVVDALKTAPAPKSREPQSPAPVAVAPSNDAYAEALSEIEEGRVEKGVWARSFSESGGDEGKAKALYIKARAESVKDAAVWVDTRPPGELGVGVKVTGGGQLTSLRPPHVTKSFATSPIETGVWVIFVLAVVGWWQYQERAKPQVVAASPLQTPAPKVDVSESMAVPNAQTSMDWDKVVITPPSALPAQSPPQVSRSRPPLMAVRESATEPAFSPQVQADLDAIAARAASDFPYLDTPAGQDVLNKIVQKRDEYIRQGQYPSVALTNAVNAFAPANAPRPNQEKRLLPVFESGDRGNHSGFDPKCRWVTPQEWSCK